MRELPTLTVLPLPETDGVLPAHGREGGAGRQVWSGLTPTHLGPQFSTPGPPALSGHKEPARAFRDPTVHLLILIVDFHNSISRLLTDAGRIVL